MSPLKTTAPKRDRQEQQEREARGGVAVEPEEARRRDRDPRARDARHQREALREADREPCRSVRSSIDRRSCGRRSAQPSSRPNAGEEDRDLPRLAEVLRDHVLEREPDDRGGNRRDDHHPGDALLARPDRSAARSVPTTRRRASTRSCQKYAADRDERAEVQRDVERLVERVVLPPGTSSRRATGRGSGGRTTRSAGARSRPARARGRAPASSAASPGRPPLRQIVRSAASVSATPADGEDDARGAPAHPTSGPARRGGRRNDRPQIAAIW